MSLTEAFIDFSLDLTFEDLPPAVRTAAGRCLLDHVGCVAGGLQTQLGQAVAEMVLSQGGQAQATVLANGGSRVPASAAALANGTAANALDYDDTLLGHPGSTVCAAALAVAELIDAGGRELVKAIVVGYDVCGRLAFYWQPEGGRYTRVWDVATLQTFGVVATVASLMQVTPQQLQNALGIAVAMAPLPRARPTYGSESRRRPMLKSAWGWAAEAGVRAVLLARAGLTGQHFVLDDLTVLWKPEWQAQSGLESPTDELGQQFLIEEVEFKPYPACRFLHPALDGITDLMQRKPFSWKDVEEVNVAGFSLLGDAFHYIPAPTSRSEAQFSTPFCVASLLYHGRLTPAAFDPQALENEAVLSLAQRVNVQTDPGYERVFPQKYGTRVTLVTRDGQAWESACDEPRGAPGRPLQEEALVSKFVQLVESSLPAVDAHSAAQRIMYIEREPSIRDFMNALG